MSTYTENKQPKVTTAELRRMKAEGRKIACLTAYDFTFARLVDEAGLDFILVGDSASNVMAGNATTLPITLDEMIIYARSVARAVNRAIVVVDLPFGSYQGDSARALESAIRVMKETGAGGIKIEGGEEIRQSVERILSAGIPVCGHLGLTPQSINKFGSYAVRAREEAEAERLLSDARMLDSLGVFAIVLEKIPAALAARVAAEVSCPVIGIGAGPDVDGQILVLQDMLGMNADFKPKFLRRYADLGATIRESLGAYVDDVRSSSFPSPQESY